MKTLLQFFPVWDDDHWTFVVVSAGEYTTRKLRAGVLDDGPVTAFAVKRSGSAMVEVSLENGEAVSVRAIEL